MTWAFVWGFVAGAAVAFTIASVIARRLLRRQERRFSDAIAVWSIRHTLQSTNEELARALGIPAALLPKDPPYRTVSRLVPRGDGE